MLGRLSITALSSANLRLARMLKLLTGDTILILAETDSLPTAREAFEGLADLHINDKATSSVYQWTYFFPTT
ncbi:hypothetical protein C8Q76DRAFT_724676 [Earliella scabrosa]|nr:hypothetical protein C8Q76DRAFT_724676 [Earliella scabrosa]